MSIDLDKLIYKYAADAAASKLIDIIKRHGELKCEHRVKKTRYGVRELRVQCWLEELPESVSSYTYRDERVIVHAAFSNSKLVRADVYIYFDEHDIGKLQQSAHTAHHQLQLLLSLKSVRA